MAKADRIGNRQRRSLHTKVPALGHYFIVTDTAETEKNYFYGLRDSLSKELQKQIVIRVLTVKTDKLIKKCKEQAELEPQYAEPWIVFDRDQVQEFDKIIKEAIQEGINVGWSNPCIEIWFDAYFGKIHSYDNSVNCCQGFAQTFLHKTTQEYKKSNTQLYAFLNHYGNQEKAIKIAEALFNKLSQSGITTPSKMCPCTTVHKLVEKIFKNL